MTRGRDWSVLRAGDPVAGDPVAVGELAARWAGTAEELSVSLRALRMIAQETTGWVSGAGRAFVDRTVEALELLEQVQPRYARTGEALHRYARELALVQDDADAVLVQAWRALEDRDAADRARRADDGLLPGRTDALAERAEQADAVLRSLDRRLQEVEQAWTTAGDAAAAALEEATADGLDDTGWDAVRSTVALPLLEQVAEVSGQLSTSLGWVALACAVVPGLQPWLPVAAAMSAAAGLVHLGATAELWAHDRTTGEELAAAVGWTVLGTGLAKAAHEVAGAARGHLDGLRLAQRIDRGAAFLTPVQAAAGRSSAPPDRGRRPARCPA